MSRNWRYFWASWAAIGAGAEIIGLTEESNTLTQHTKALRAKKAVRFAAGGFLIWLLYHWVIQDWSLTHHD